MTRLMFLLSVIWLSTIVSGGCDLDIPCHVEKAIKKGMSKGRELLGNELLGSLGDVVKDTLKPQFETVTNYVKDIKSKAGSIKDVADNIESTTDSIKTKAEDIVDDVVELLDILKNGAFSLIDMGEDVVELADILSKCSGDLLNGLLGDAVPFTEILNIFKTDFDFIPIDPEQLVLIGLAAQLLPFKSHVEYICVDKLEMIVELTTNIRDIFDSDRRRMEEKRRMFVNGDCDETFCKPATWDDPYQSGINYRIMIGYLYPGFFQEDLKPYPDTFPPVNADRLQIWRSIQFSLKPIGKGINNWCNVLNACASPDKVFECAKEAQKKSGCSKLKGIFSIVSSMVDYAVSSAGYHNTRVLSSRVAALFKDRENIIHNQFALRDRFTKLYEWLDDKFDDVFKNLDHLEELSKTVQGQRKHLEWEPSEIDAPYARNEQPKMINNETGFVVIKLNLIDLCIFGAGFILIMMVVLIILFKYFNGNSQKASNHRLEYSHSEAEHINNK